MFMKRRWIIPVVLLASSFTLIRPGNRETIALTTVERTATGSVNSAYVSNRQPLSPLHFIPLPPGSIRPEGWIRKYLELQRDGLTGQLGNISAWLDKHDNAWFSGNGTGNHGWEEVPYWLKGYGDLGYCLQDEKIIAETKLWLDKVLQSQRPDGFFGPAFVENEHQHNTGATPDLWPNMIMLWCLQSWYEYSKDPRVLPFMSRYFKWQTTIPENKLLKIYWENSRGGDNLYSIYWLYNRTGEDWLLQLAEKIHRNTANWMQQDSLPNWHNVNIAQCFREPATYYMQTRDSNHLRATYQDFMLVRKLYGQVPGGMFGADENARKGYADPRQAIETCGMVEQMASDEILAAITGDPFWADHCEDVAFNTYPAAVMPDFKALRYLTAPNMVVSDSKNHAPGIDNSGPFLMMNPFSSRCCQHNHAQGWPYYAKHLWMATPDNGVAAMLYNSCEVKATVAGNTPVTIKEQTHYPFDEHISLEISAAGKVRFPLYLRIPAWCKNAKVYVNKELQEVNTRPGTYLCINKEWNNHDQVELELPMQLRVQHWTENKNSVSVYYGPLAFSLQIREDYRKMDSKASAIGDSKWQPNVDASAWPSFEIYPGSAWNYGLLLDQQQRSLASFRLVKKAWPASNFPFTQQDVPLAIQTTGKSIPSWKTDRYGLCGLLPQSPVQVNTPQQELTLIPMGAARLRIASFPVAK
jgi:hypothetical protein